MYYILKNKIPQPVSDVIEWAKEFDGSPIHVDLTQLPNNVSVSTVFLGIDHNYGDGKPILFETMIFGGEHDGYQKRYSTWGQAEQGHKEAIELTFQVITTK